MVAGLRDDDFYARATAIGVLSSHATAADAPLVLSAYTKSLSDAGNDARIAAISYLAAAWKRDSAAFPSALRQPIST